MRGQKGIVVFVVAPPSTHKGTFAGSFLASPGRFIFHEWLNQFTYQWLEDALVSGADIVITTTPNWFKEFIEPSPEYQRLLKNFTCKRLDLTNLNDLLQGYP